MHLARFRGRVKGFELDPEIAISGANLIMCFLGTWYIPGGVMKRTEHIENVTAGGRHGILQH